MTFEEAFLDAATKAAVALAVIGAVVAALSVALLLFERSDRKRASAKYDPTFAPRVAAGLREWRHGR